MASVLGVGQADFTLQKASRILDPGHSLSPTLMFVSPYYWGSRQDVGMRIPWAAPYLCRFRLFVAMGHYFLTKYIWNF
jgi:hypothetical protein